MSIFLYVIQSVLKLCIVFYAKLRIKLLKMQCVLHHAEWAQVNNNAASILQLLHHCSSPKSQKDEMEPGNGKLNSTEWCLNQNDCLIIPNIQFYGLQIPFLNLLAHITARLSLVMRSVYVMLCCTRYITRKKSRELEESGLFMNINFFSKKSTKLSKYFTFFYAAISSLIDVVIGRKA